MLLLIVEYKNVCVDDKKKHGPTESMGGGGVVDGKSTETYKYYLHKLNKHGNNPIRRTE